MALGFQSGHAGVARFKKGSFKMAFASTGRENVAASVNESGSCPSGNFIDTKAPATLRPPGMPSKFAEHYCHRHWRALNLPVPDAFRATGCSSLVVEGSRPASPLRPISRPRSAASSGGGHRSGGRKLDPESSHPDPAPCVAAATAELLATCAITEHDRRMRGAIETSTPELKNAHSLACPRPGVGRAGRAAKAKRAAELRRTAEAASQFQQAALDAVVQGTGAAEAVADAVREENESLQLALHGLYSAEYMEASAHKLQEDIEWRQKRTRCAIIVQRLWRGRRIRQLMQSIKAEVDRRREAEHRRNWNNLRRPRPVRFVSGFILDPTASERLPGERKNRRKHRGDLELLGSSKQEKQATRAKARPGMLRIETPVDDVLERMIERQAAGRMSPTDDMSNISDEGRSISQQDMRGVDDGLAESFLGQRSSDGGRSQMGSEAWDSPRDSAVAVLPRSDDDDSNACMRPSEIRRIPPDLRASLELLPLLVLGGKLTSAVAPASAASTAKDCELVASPAAPPVGKTTSEKSSVRQAITSATPPSLPSPTNDREDWEATNIELSTLRPVFSDQAALTLRNAMLRDIRHSNWSPAGKALLASKESIRNKYMMSCRYWHVKPNSLVLCRLAEPAVDDRSLGPRSVFYDFGGAHVGDRGVVCVLQALAEDAGCSRVSLRACGLHGASAPVLSAFLELHCGLRHMDLSSNGISFEAGEMILESLQRRSRGNSFVGGDWFSPAKPASFRLPEATVDLGFTFLDPVHGPTAGPPCGSYWADSSGNRLRGRLHVAPDDYERLGEQLDGTSKVQYGGTPRSRSPSRPPSPRDSLRPSLAE